MAAGEGPGNAEPEPTPPLLVKAETPDPNGRKSFAYDRYVTEQLSKWYAAVVEKIEEATQEEDCRYHYTVAKGDLRAVLKDIPKIRQYVQYHPEEKENPCRNLCWRW